MSQYHSHGLEHWEGATTMSIRRRGPKIIQIEVKDEFSPDVTFNLSKQDVKKLSDYLIETLKHPDA